MCSAKSRVPLDVRKASMVLGLNPEKLSWEVVIEAWGKQILNPTLEATAGDGSFDPVIQIDMAKGVLLRWLEGPNGVNPTTPKEA